MEGELAVRCLTTFPHPKPVGHGAGCAEVGVEGELAVYNPRGGARKQFKFDRVFGPAATQAEVYEDTKFLIRSVLDGAQQRNCCMVSFLKAWTLDE